MHYKALTPSAYLAAGDFGGPEIPAEATFTIRGEEFGELPSMKPGAKMTDKETKGMIRLEGPGAKPWIANKTNMTLLAAMFGDDTEGWRGKRVTLHAVPDSVGAKEELAIRVMGSPDLDRARDVEIKFRGRRAKTYRLVPTGRPSGPTPLEAFRARVTTDLKLDAAVVEEWLVSVEANPAKMNAEEFRLCYKDLADTKGEARLDFDAFAAKRAEGGAK